MSYSKKYVAFLDIPGFKEVSKNSEKETGNIVRTTQDFAQFIGEIAKKYDNNGKEIVIMTFSDSIYMSYPEGQGAALICDIQQLQQQLAVQGYFFRGGVVYDDIYDKEGQFYGPAQIEAYEIESSAAVYPRVVISDECYEHLALEINGSTPITQDVADGSYFVDFLGTYNGVGLDVKKIENNINKNIEKKESPLSVKCKYRWLNRYYNSCKEKWTFKENTLIDGSKYRI